MAGGKITMRRSRNVPEGEVWVVPPRRAFESDEDYARRIVRVVNVGAEARPADGESGSAAREGKE
jgi:hypothetical protein